MKPKNQQKTKLKARPPRPVPKLSESKKKIFSLPPMTLEELDAAFAKIKRNK